MATITLINSQIETVETKEHIINLITDGYVFVNLTQRIWKAEFDKENKHVESVTINKDYIIKIS